MSSKNCFIPTIIGSGSQLPQYKTPESAGADLCSVEQSIIAPNSSGMINTKVSIAIPEGYVGLVTSRSGLALKNGIFVLNSPGIIDSDYRGEIGVILFNTSSEPFLVQESMRIAQLVIIKYERAVFSKVDSLPETDRGSGGFGSTGLL